MYLVESVQQKNFTEIVVFSRTDKNTKSMQRINDFKPYFYVLEDDVVPDDWRINRVEKGYTSILGEELKKVYTRKSTDVPSLRSRFKKYYEGDILFTKRYIIDKIGEIDPYPLKLLSVDIETKSDKTFPNMEKPNQEIISIGMKDSFDGKKTILALKSDKWSPTTVKELENLGYQIFETEEELLNRFLMAFQIYDPDVITGYNVEKFDLTYLIRRMEQLGVNYLKMSPLNFVKIDEKYGNVTIRGRVIVDMMRAYSHFRRISNQGKAESYSLEFTSQEVLGVGKLPHRESFQKFWENNPKEHMEYNMRDVELVLDIEKKLGIIEFFNILRCKTCSLLSNIYHTSLLIDGLLLRRCKDKIVLPSNMKKGDGEKYSGAFVIPPIPGVYKNVLALDIKGMYPNIIKTFNIGYETFNPNGEIAIEEGIGFNKGIGLLSETVRDLESERNDNKKLRDNAKNDDDYKFYECRQYGVKVLSNAIYGYLGYEKSRFYRKEIANAITTLGRKILKWTQSVLENKGYNVIYGDTDSVYIQSKHDNLLDMLKEGRELVAMINESYIKFAEKFNSNEPSLEIEFEKIFKRVIFVGKKGEDDNTGAKKKYAYITLWKDGKKVTDKVEYVGFGAVRSNTPRIARQVQKKVLKMILNDVGRDKVVTYLKKTDKDIRTRVTPDDEFSFPQGISNDIASYGRKITKDGKTYKSGVPPVIAGIRYSNKYLGTRFEKGNKPKWIYIKYVQNGFPDTTVISFDSKIPDGFIPDFDKMNERIFEMKLSKIFEAAGWGEFPNLNPVKTLKTWGL